jgi:molecular chaperone GrpE
MGVQPITTAGETFDPNFHEAVGVEERNDVPPNTVFEEMLRGYRIGNRVVRHSMVRVSTANNKVVTRAANELPDLDPEDNSLADELDI